MKHTFKFHFWLSLIIIFCICGICTADRIVLKGGQTLTGEILAQKPDKLIVDLGVVVLSIETEEVLEYEFSSKNGAIEVEQAEPNERILHRSQGRFYHTCEREKTTVTEAVDIIGEAVVKVSSPAGMGSGFFLNEDGYLITNYHVIEKETKIEVTVFEQGEEGFEKRKFKKVKIAAINPFIDLALLKLEEANDIEITCVCLANINELKVGEEVFAIGNPLGLERTVTDGVISTINRSFKGLVYLQTNADINPGNSGGPLFNLAGQVVGVTNMGYIFFGGLGFAIPVDYVKHFIENREAFAYDKDNPNTGYRYLQPEPRRIKGRAEFLFLQEGQ